MFTLNGSDERGSDEKKMVNNHDGRCGLAVCCLLGLWNGGELGGGEVEAMRSV